MALEIGLAQAVAIVYHARQQYPNECCGLVAGRGSRVERVFLGTNVERSPFTYRFDPQEQFRFFREMDVLGLELLGIYHSHPRSPAYPSQTDIAQAFYPEAAYLIVSLPSADAPAAEVEVCAFRIQGGVIAEEELTVAL
ncbi:MAG: M67 family metallopeptidase [Armatimonadetes bacterium]|nr:M67 family metallopeptidase [Armatimonadota bacterium]